MIIANIFILQCPNFDYFFLNSQKYIKREILIKNMQVVIWLYQCHLSTLLQGKKKEGQGEEGKGKGIL